MAELMVLELFIGNFKVADAYTLDHTAKRSFRPYGSVAYDNRILTWNMAEGLVSVWSLDGRLAIPFACGERQRELLAFQRGETDLVYRKGQWFLFTTVDVPEEREAEVMDWLGVDFRPNVAGVEALGVLHKRVAKLQPSYKPPALAGGS